MKRLKLILTLVRYALKLSTEDLVKAVFRVWLDTPTALVLAEKIARGSTYLYVDDAGNESYLTWDEVEALLRSRADFAVEVNHGDAN